MYSLFMLAVFSMGLLNHWNPPCDFWFW